MRSAGRFCIGCKATLIACCIGTGALADAGAEPPRPACYARQGDRVLLDESGTAPGEPASTLKILVAAVALEHLGPEFRTTTRVTIEGRVEGQRVDGDLVWHAAGDPTWNRRFFPDDPERPVKALVAPLVKRGIRHIEGDLILDLRAFPGRAFPPTRSMDEVAFVFGSPTSGLALDENTVKARIAPGPRVGAAARVETVDKGSPLKLENRMLTVPKERHERGSVDIQPIWDSLTLHLRGEYPISEPPYNLELAVPDGDLFAGARIRRVLEEAGVTLAGEVRTRRRYDAAPSRKSLPVSTWTSPPLAEWIQPILRDSQSWYADMLLRHLADAEHERGRLDAGLDVLNRFLIDELGLDESRVHLDDASGISPYNLISPRALVETLQWALGRPWRAVFIDALPRSKQGTLNAWPALPEDAAAKTGTHRHSSTLAGYLRLDSPRPITFACFANHRTETKQVLRKELVSRIFVLSAPKS